MSRWLLSRLAVLCLLLVGCSWVPPVQDGGPNSDGDGDADMDGDVDGDADGDADGDGDRIPPDETCGRLDGADNECPGLCGNGADDDRDGLADCVDLGCLQCPSCCDELDEPWIHSVFSDCESFAACAWTPFRGDGDVPTSVRLDTESGVALGGDGIGEVGLYSDREVGLGGQPTLTFVASLDRDQCEETLWRQALGVALTDQVALTSGTGVVPALGLVLDGEREVAIFFVSGRPEQEIPIDRAMLAEPHTYGFGVTGDGRAQFWVGLAADADPLADPPFEATYISSTEIDLGTSGLRVAAYGRLHGIDVATLESLQLSRRVCDVPAGWSQPSDRAVLSVGASRQPVSSPAVVERPDGTLLLVFETPRGFQAATSEDRGQSWELLGPILTDQAPTQYGRVARSSPTLVHWAPPDEEGPPSYHLWFRCDAEAGVGSLPGVTPTAICHAESTEGVEWTEDESSSIAVLGGEEGAPWRAEVSAPTVVVTDGGYLSMWFVGKTEEGETNLLRATSDNGKEWTLLDGLLLDRASALSFERDGIAEPVVIQRRGVFYLWYVGVSGSRSTIGYAISADGVTWNRYGPVFAPSLAWQGNSVTGPAVLPFPSDEGDFEVLHMWYEAGTVGRERMGLVIREVPDGDPIEE